jgi:hypothetical protein
VRFSTRTRRARPTRSAADSTSCRSTRRPGVRSPVQYGRTTADSVQAIEDATTDGADVLNFSISGSLTSSVGAVEAAFFGAAQAGVFVSTSAGNDGPGASTVAHNARGRCRSRPARSTGPTRSR